MDAYAVVDWYRANARELPWRAADTTAWGTLVSEVMLQQTPVARVIPVWEQWMRRWPRPSALAAETQGEAVRAWGKLGYPRRAMRLHECAAAIADSHNDVVPSDVEILLSLPGIGAYTARAVACFAYGQRVPVVDTNVRRVIARATAADDSARTVSPADFRAAEALLPTEQETAAVFSAAVMELGATICTARNPVCGGCPIVDCAWVAAGRPAGAGPTRTQPFAGTDRQVRGLLLDVLRDASGPVERVALDIVWPRDPGQRQRALDSLLLDGLIEQTDSGLFALAGEAG
ncbi:MAG: A/G-specific adenine glycosylase [Nocardiaceae bacterium]|nr:A/G-specific adenine glycosylase [Nocardiaceae bacterium]